MKANPIESAPAIENVSRISAEAHVTQRCRVSRLNARAKSGAPEITVIVMSKFTTQRPFASTRVFVDSTVSHPSSVQDVSTPW